MPEESVRFSAANLEVRVRKQFPRLQYLISLLTIPIYCVLFYWKNKSASDTHFEDAIVCQVDGKKSHKMFVSLFGDYSNLRFVIEKYCILDQEHFEYFSNTEVESLGLVIKGLSSGDLKKLKALTKNILLAGLTNFRQLSKYGALLLELYGNLMRGILQSVDASRSVFLTYEHLFVPNAVRNELLRADGNLSISLPYGTQIESHFFASGYRYNYDILCSTGKLQERVYAMQKAQTTVILPVGPYEINKATAEDKALSSRIQRLREFKKEHTSITILSSGIQAETYSGEVQLIQLAKKLAADSGIKVFIRPKPVPPPIEYRGVLEDLCKENDSIMLTGSEYQLTDFLPVTDLFLTFSSHSAADICAAGGRIFSINFLDDDAFTLWQSAVQGVYLESDTAFDSIMSWVKDAPPGQKAIHDERMIELRQMIAYNYLSFDLYKRKLLGHLAPYLPLPR